jgi:hypothetical protein
MVVRLSALRTGRLYLQEYILVGSFKEDNRSSKRGSKTQSFHTSEHKVTLFWDVTTCGLYTLNCEGGPS